MVSVPLADERPPLQGVSRMEDAAESSVGGGTEGDREMEEPVEDPRSSRRPEVQPGGARFPYIHRRGEEPVPSHAELHGARRRVLDR